MYRFSVTIDIAAAPARVWHALCDPSEVVRWDTGVVEALDAPPDYPRPGQHVRWRYANGPFRTLHDRPIEVVPQRTLRSLISIGPLRFDETYTLDATDAGTRLTASMDVTAPLPGLGLLIERLYAGPESRRTVEASLRAIRAHCESNPHPDLSVTPLPRAGEGQGGEGTLDPKALAQERFAKPSPEGIDLIGRLATDPPLIVRGLLDAVRERAAPGSRVIELGFGSGWLLEELRGQMQDVSLLGLDLSPGNAARAHELYGDRVRVVVGDIERLPFAATTFDVIVTCWTLYFMRDIDAALVEIKRCLTPRGRLIAATSAPDHEIEFNQLVAQATLTALGREVAGADIGRRFDLETGAAYIGRHFPNVEVREWHGEMAVSDLADMLALWPKWQPAGLETEETELVRAAYERLAAVRLQTEGSLRGRRHDGAFVCDLASP